MEAHPETLALPADTAPAPAPAPAATRARRLGALTGALAGEVELKTALLIPGVLTVFLSFNSGGFFPGSTALAAVELAVMAGLLTLVARRPLEGVSPLVLVCAAGLALLAGWTLLSSQWSHSESRALLSYDRVLLYLLALVAFGSIARSESRMRTVVYGIAAGIVVVCVAALIARTLPHVLPTPSQDPRPERLSYPLTYWNALAMVAGAGIILCGHFACSLRDSWVVRALGAAAVPLLTATLYYTFSRGATWATAVGIVVYVCVARPRGALSAAIATIPTTLVALITVNPATPLTAHPGSAAAIASGRHTAIVLGGCALAAALIRVALVPLDRRFERLRITRRTRRVVAAGVLVSIALALAVGLTAGGLSKVISEKVAQFNSSSATTGPGGSSRFLSASANGRIEQWQLALKDYQHHTLHGAGAGTFATLWAQKRKETELVLNAHSLYLETLNELGWPGLAMLVLGLGGLLVGLAMRARGPGRGIYAALLGAAVAWALHGAVDWDWQMPGVSLWLFAAAGLALARPIDDSPSPRRMRRRWLRVPVAAGLLALALVPAQVLASENHQRTGEAAYRAGDCKRANAAAATALSALPSRPDPRTVLAGCAIATGAPAAAVDQMNRAVAVDPNSWMLWYDLAVARAAAGRNPRPAALRAHALNPLEPATKRALGLARGGKRNWRRAATQANILVP